MKSKRQRRRRAVNRTERVKPSAMAEAKKRPWPLQQMLQRGPDNDGISADQFEAAIEIVEAHDALTRSLGFQACTLDSIGIVNDGYDNSRRMTEREARLAAIYVAWSADLLHRAGFAGHIVVEWINDERPCGIGMVPFLCRALDFWMRHRDENLTAPSRRELTAPRRGVPTPKASASASHRSPIR